MLQQDKAVLQCSICLDEVVASGGERSTARLLCGHHFHLDCIGSAFNAKGIMQCPYCRQTERGNWLFPTGPRPLLDIPYDDLVFDEDVDDFDDPEDFQPLRFQPLLPSLFDGTEPSPSNSSLSERSTSRQDAYIYYFQPPPPPASSSNFLTAETSVDGSTRHDHWNPMAGPLDSQPLQTVHSIDFHHNPWTHMTHFLSPPNYNNGVAEQPGLAVGAMRIVGLDSAGQQRWPLPPLYGNGAESVSPMSPLLLRACTNIIEQFQQGSSSFFPGSQQYGDMRPLGAIGEHAPMPFPDIPFYLFPPPSSGSRSGEATESFRGNSFYSQDWGYFGPNSSMNNEEVWPSSSRQQPSLDIAESSYASSRRLLW